MITAIAVILSIAVGAVAAWFVYRIFNKNKGPGVGPFRFVKAVSERKDATMKYDLIKSKVGLPASTAGDVVSRELTISRVETAGGVLKAEEVISTSMMELEFEAVQDSLVDLSCVAIDDAGNRSEPVEATFAVADTVAPELVGGFTSITAIGERTVGEDPAPSDSAVASPAEGESEVGPDELGDAEADAKADGESDDPPTGEATAEPTATPGD